ncbi:hypothetical protein DPMN_106709 [Dreissena polymorpha]|uniref:Uncharacterized protein n=1 Tax=Dreissena polymorpha TaxID=45954 RepID=A0A9D4QKA3_DREPO|nr:hypothetical protein DPMN_106709 [Dreissena polymorpha]
MLSTSTTVDVLCVQRQMHHHQEVDQRRPAENHNYMWHWTLENMGQFTEHMWNH